MTCTTLPIIVVVAAVLDVPFADAIAAGQDTEPRAFTMAGSSLGNADFGPVDGVHLTGEAARCFADLRYLRARQPDLPHRHHEPVRRHGEPRPNRISTKRVTARAIAEQVELVFLDSVLHLTARAVQLLVQVPLLVFAAPERCDDKPRVRSLAQMLGLADNAPRARPRLVGSRWPTRRLGRCGTSCSRPARSSR